MGGMAAGIKMGLDTLFAYNASKIQKASLGAQKTLGQAQISVANLLAETNANAENVLRGENNTLVAARSALANLQRSEHNESILKTAGARYGTANTNVLRVIDSHTQGSLERRIQGAEQQGALMADAAMRGVGGSSVQMLKIALAATSARRETQIEDRQGHQTYDMLAARAGIMSGAVAALDEGQTFAPIDLRQTQAHKEIEPMWERDFFSTRNFMQGQIGGSIASGAASMYGRGGSSSNGTASPSGGGNGGEGSMGGGNGWYSTNDSNMTVTDDYGSTDGGYGDGYGPE